MGPWPHHLSSEFEAICSDYTSCSFGWDWERLVNVVGLQLKVAETDQTRLKVEDADQTRLWAEDADQTRLMRGSRLKVCDTDGS